MGFVRPTLNLEPSEGEEIRTLPELIEFHRVHNASYEFCQQAWKGPDGHTFLHVDYQQLHMAISRCQAWLRTNLDLQTPLLLGDGTVAKAAPVALLMESHVGLAIYTLALMGLGVPAVLLSARLSSVAVAHLLRETGVEKILVSPRLHSITREAAIDVAVFDPTAYQELLAAPDDDLSSGGPVVALPLHYVSETDRNVLILHSSGTTGLPKPIYCSHRHLLGFALCHEFTDEIAPGLLVSTSPFFHKHQGFGLVPMCLSLGVGKPFAIPPTTTILTGLSVIELLEDCKAKALLTVPSILEEIALLPSDRGLRVLRKLDFVAFGGGLPKESIAQRLVSAGVRLINHYGATETGPMTPFFQPEPSHDWHFFQLRVDTLVPLQVRLEPVENEQPPQENAFKMSMRPFGWTERFELQDLLIHHPAGGDRCYTAAGRIDDLICLATGEKVRPTILEQLLGRQESVNAATAFGNNKFELGVIVEARDAVDNEKAFKDSIWPVIEDAGRQMDAHARISSPHAVLVVAPGTLPRSDKGTVLRKEVYKMFHKEIDQVYQRLDLIVDAPPIDCTAPTASVRALIQANIRQPEGEWSDEDDLFQLGMDSLQATKIRRLLSAAVANTPEIEVEVSPEFVYKHASVQKLVDALLQRSSDAVDIHELVNRYSGPPRTVLITGSTGSLASFVLAQLLNDPSVAKIICLNRVGKENEDPVVQQRKTMASRGIEIDDARWSRVEIVSTNIPALGLGLEPSQYNDIVSRVTHILHLAWPMSFHMQLSSFEASFRTISNFVQLAGDISRRQLALKPRLLFISSIATVGRYPMVHGERIVAEAPMTDPNCALGLGYARAKWVCEQIIDRAARKHPELDLGFVRVGQVAGSRRGYWNMQEHFVALVQSSQKLGAFPDLKGTLSWLPVDTAATVLAELLLDPQPLQLVYHLENPIRQGWREVMDVLMKETGVQTSVPMGEWIERVKSSPTGDNPAQKLISFLEEDFERMSCGGIILSTETTRRASPTLRRTGPVEEAQIRAFQQTSHYRIIIIRSLNNASQRFNMVMREEPRAIAIIGMGCKFPGADSLEEYWQLLDDGRSMTEKPPAGRFPTHDHPRSTDKSVFWGNFVRDVECFDHRFFKKSSREAASMDPQQRLLLEVAYHALESSGYFGPRKQQETDIGCFIGVCASDYNDNVAGHPPNAFSTLGTLRAFLTGKISHFFGFTGPSVSLDTACSSSAVAIDSACKSILYGDCTTAIAGGVSLFTSPHFYQNLAAASFLSSTGATKSFDAGADGYCRGEGIGLVVLKEHSRAVADGDPILATILSTAIRQSSNQVPITVPYSPSQTALYRKVLAMAGVAPEEVTYLEAHGTGTPIGDPQEFLGIREVFGVEGRRDPLYFASVKGNIGHTEGASGVAGLIKTVLMMQHRRIPRQASFTTLNPKIALTPGQLEIPTRTIEWTASTRIACINNYGAAGSIAAMVVREPAPPAPEAVQTIRTFSRYPIFVSGNSPKSLAENCTRLRSQIAQMPPSAAYNQLANITFHLSDKQNRSLPYSVAASVSSMSELDDQLRIAATSAQSSSPTSSSPKPLVLLFGGQTNRSIGLRRDVYEASALLRRHLDRCDEILRSFGHAGLYPAIFDPTPMDDVVALQSMQFALQYASAMSWIDGGLRVSTVLGHSFGQLVALTVSGVLSLVDGLKLVHGRAMLMRTHWGSERGSMIALDTDHGATMRLIASVQQQDSSLVPEVACYNGPKSHVLVGSAAEIDALVNVLTKSAVSKHKVLNVTHGFHSRFCDPILPALEQLAASLTFHPPRIPLETCSDREAWGTITPKMIADHTRTPVFFEDAVKRLAARHGPSIWLEAGSNSSITSMARRALSDTGNSRDSVFLPINLSREDVVGGLVDTTVCLWKHSHHAQFWPFHRQSRAAYQPLQLPPYAFERTRHWLDYNQMAPKVTATIEAPSSSAAAGSPSAQEAVVAPVVEPEPQLLTFLGFTNTQTAAFMVDPRSTQWSVLVEGHAVLEQPLCPAPLYVELVLQAAREIATHKNIPAQAFARVEDLEITASLGRSQDKMLSLVLSQTENAGRWIFAFHARDRSTLGSSEHQKGPVHATGKIKILPAADESIAAELLRTGRLLRGTPFDSLGSDLQEEAVQGTVVYQLFSRVVQYHDWYKGVRRVAARNGMVVATVVLPEQQPECTAHLLGLPVAVDNFLQVPGLYANCLAPCPADEVFVCTRVDRIQLAADFSSSTQGWTVVSTSTLLSEKEMSNDVFVLHRGTGKVVAMLFGARFSRVRITSLAKVLSRGTAPVAVSGPFSAPVSSVISQRPEPVVQTKASIEVALRALLSKITDVPEDSFQGSVTLEELGIDSLMATEIVAEVQEAFGATIPQEELQNMLTFAALRDYLDARVDAGSSVPARPVASVPLPPSMSPPSAVPRQVDSAPVALLPKETSKDMVWQLASLLASHLECPIEALQHDTNLASVGLDSLLCMELASDVQQSFGVIIDVTQLTNSSSFGDLVNMLADAVGPSPSSSMSPLSMGTSTLTTPPAEPEDELRVEPSTAEFLSNSQKSFESIKPEFDVLAKKYKFFDFYKTVYPKNSQLVLAYTVEAFATLGIDLSKLSVGEPIPVLPSLPKHHHLKAVLYEILRDGDVADYTGREYVRADTPIPTVHSSTLFRQLVDEFPQHAQEHRLLHLCGSELGQLISGAKDPLTVLFGSKANRDILEDVYSTGPMYVIMSQLLALFLERTLGGAFPGPNGVFRILELGAGTGSTTKWVVDRLVKCGIPIEYTFTDISSSLVKAAKRKFAGYSCMNYATINIEMQPPVEHHGQYDIVLSTNCIHATSSLPTSLRHIRMMLKPHGFVALVEFTSRMFWFDLVFGLLEGWWLFNDGREYVLAEPQFWEKCMKQSGFEHVSWTGGSTTESQVVRVIAGFVQPAADASFTSIPQNNPSSVETLAFKHSNGVPLRADIYHPSAAQASSHSTWTVALMVHGGGFVMLSRKDVRPRQTQLLLDHGLLPVAVDYRLCPEVTILDGPLTDVSDAYAWARTVLPSLKLKQPLRIDSTKVAVIGWSTGGTLALSLAWTSIPRGLPAPDAILAFYCPTDYEDPFWTAPNIPKHSEPFITREYNILDAVKPFPITAYNVPPHLVAMGGWMAPQDPRSQLVLHMNWRGQTLPVLFRGLPAKSTVSGNGPAQDTSKYHDMPMPAREEIIKTSPLAQVVRGNYKSPTHIVFGTADDLIPWQQARHTVDAMRQAGVDAELTLLPGEPHLFDLFRDPDGKRWEAIQPAYQFLFDRCR
ncbi:hypothetical protein HFD88_004294 [Aspergillus terreus]|nr:hypothetical protein HFD88_004294 [Aspergillus terreus]